MSWQLDADLRANLVCPKCRGELVDVQRGLLCPTDRVVYLVRDGVPWMVDEVSERATAEELAAS